MRLTGEATTANCRRFVALFRVLIDSGSECILYDFVHSLLMLLAAAPGTTNGHIREAFLQEATGKMDHVAEAVMLALLIDGRSTAPGAAVVAQRQRFVDLVRGMAASLPDRLVSEWCRCAPATCEVPLREALAPAVSNAPRHADLPRNNLFGSVVTATLRILRIELGEDSDRAVDEAGQKAALGADAQDVQPEECSPLAASAAELLAELVAQAIAGFRGNDDAKESFSLHFLFIAENVVDLLHVCLRGRLVVPQAALLQTLTATLRFIEAQQPPKRPADAADGAKGRAPAQGAQRRTTTHAIMASVATLCCTGLYQGAAAELNPGMAFYGLLRQWTGATRALLPWLHQQLPMAIEKLIETQLAIIGAVGRRAVTSITAFVLTTTLHTTREIINFMFLESTKATEGGAATAAKDQGSSSLMSLFAFGSSPQPDAAVLTHYHVAQQKLRAAHGHIVDALVALLRALPPSKTPNAKIANAVSTVKDALTGVVHLLLRTAPTTVMTLNYLMHNIIRRHREKPYGLIEWARNPSTLPSEDVVVVQLVTTVDRWDLCAVLKTTMMVVQSHHGAARSRASQARTAVDADAMGIYVANACLTIGMPISTSADVGNDLRDLCNLVLVTSAAPLTIALVAVLLQNFRRVLRPEPGERVTWLPTTLQRTVTMSAERSSLNASVLDAVKAVVDALGADVWGKDAEGLVRIGATLRDRAAALLEVPNRNEAAALSLLSTVLHIIGSTEVGASLRINIAELLFKDAFFRMGRAAMTAWRSVVNIIGFDKAVYDHIIKRAHTTTSLTSGISHAAQAQDCVLRGRSLKRLAFFVFASTLRVTDLRLRLPQLRKFLVDSFRQFRRCDDHDAVRYCFLLFRVLLVKVPIAHHSKLQPFWSVVIPEAISALHRTTKIVAGGGHCVHADRCVLLEVLKLIDFCLVLAPSDFHTFRWVFFDDHQGVTARSFTPLLEVLRAVDLTSADGARSAPRVQVVRPVLPPGSASNRMTKSKGDDVTPLRPLLSIPECRYDSIAALDAVGNALTIFSTLVDVDCGQFTVDDSAEEEGSCRGMVRRDDVVDFQYIDWLLENDFIQGNVESLDVFQGADSEGDAAAAAAGAPRPMTGTASRASSHGGDTEGNAIDSSAIDAGALNASAMSATNDGTVSVASCDDDDDDEGDDASEDAAIQEEDEESDDPMI
jgi:hypothetical protein